LIDGTPMTDGILKDSEDEEKRRDDFIKNIPLSRLGSVNDVASGALFFASDEAAFFTGISLPVDGGSYI
jgi:NAD(P)-dependent dehydrogenase (short-subunit alcohol dehydrogenase family)